MLEEYTASSFTVGICYGSDGQDGSNLRPKKETVCCCETSMNSYLTIRRHVWENTKLTLHNHCCENLRSVVGKFGLHVCSIIDFEFRIFEPQNSLMKTCATMSFVWRWLIGLVFGRCSQQPFPYRFLLIHHYSSIVQPSYTIQSRY
jgi:hypothetical protein